MDMTRAMLARSLAAALLLAAGLSPNASAQNPTSRLREIRAVVRGMPKGTGADWPAPP